MSVVETALNRAIADLQNEQASGRNVERGVAFLKTIAPTADRPLDMFWALKQATRAESQFLTLRRR